MDEQSPRVTALVVARDEAADLRRCLECLEQSTDRDRVEVLVVDDGSTDGTPEVASDFPDAILMRMPKRLGWTRAVNIGLRTAKGDNVLLLPPAFRVQPATVATLADRLEQSPDVGAVCPATAQVWTFPSPEALATAWKTGHLPGGRTPEQGEAAVDYPMGTPIMIRRQLLRGMNYLDARFGHAWSDLELCCRIRSGGKKILVLSDAVVDGDAREPEIGEMEWTDSAHGIATWIGLHHGFGPALRFRLQAALHALGRGKFSVFTGVLSGEKIDGNQS